MSDTAADPPQRQWLFHVDDMIRFTTKALTYTSCSWSLHAAGLFGHR